MCLKAHVFVLGLPDGNNAALRIYKEIQKYIYISIYES